MNSNGGDEDCLVMVMVEAVADGDRLCGCQGQ